MDTASKQLELGVELKDLPACSFPSLHPDEELTELLVPIA